jgi:4-hydroxybenzoate polyprenyltransferase
MSSAASEKHNSQASIIDYFFFLRPMLHPPVWTIVILGYFRAADLFSTKLLILLLISSAAASWAYIVNQLSDIESDKLNRKLFFLPDNIISPISAKFLAAAMLMLTLVGGFYLGINIGLLFTVGLALGYAYSIRPFDLKSRPLAGILSNAIAHGILPFAAGYMIAGGEPEGAFSYSIPYFLAVGGVFIGTTIPDYFGDQKAGKITLAVRYGLNRAGMLMAICAILAVITAVFVRDIPMVLAGSLSLPFYILNWRRVSERNSAMAAKVSVLLLTLGAGWFFWPYLILVAILILATRQYYRRRFKMTYPKLA